MTNPGGKPLAVRVAAGVPPVVNTRKMNGCPTLPVAAELLIITGPAVGNCCTVIKRVAAVVPPLFEANNGTWNVPVAVGVPAIVNPLSVNPGGRVPVSSAVAPGASI